MAAPKSPLPSYAAKLLNFCHEQDKCPIWNGQPLNHSIPVQLYYSAFTKFLSVAKGSTLEIMLDPKDYSTTQSLFHAATQLYKNEAKHVEATVFLEKNIHHRTLLTISTPVIQTNGACVDKY
jgi:hypothetical protein